MNVKLDKSLKHKQNISQDHVLFLFYDQATKFKLIVQFPGQNRAIVRSL